MRLISDKTIGYLFLLPLILFLIVGGLWGTEILGWIELGYGQHCHVGWSGQHCHWLPPMHVH